MREHNYFVRTRDKIYQGRDDFVILKDQELYIKHFQDHIVTIAETIEELVDEYVRVHKTFNNMSMVCDKELAISSSKYPKHYDVYGSIWVDGELHKVAKMNDEGELELL